LSNQIGFYNERKAVDVVYLDFRKPFDTMSCNNHKLTKHRLDSWTVKWVTISRTTRPRGL